MPTTRRFLLAASTCLFAAGATPAMAGDKITVAFAGSMGVVMDRGIGPAFTVLTGTQFQGIGQPSMALAHLLAGNALNADVFVPVSAAPAKVVEAAGLADGAVPVASTSMVLPYSPKSQFAAAFAAKDADWTKILTTPGLRFARSDPATDPQGQYSLYTLQLAEKYYKLPGFAAQVARAVENPAQIFAETSQLARLQDGELDATVGYESAVISQRLPFIVLPPEINFGNPALAKDWYNQAELTLKGKTTHPSPLVFYAAVLKNAANPRAAQAFVDFLYSPRGQEILEQYGYNPGKGKSL
jgi:molybdate/tungstate transport system substrate-binding protein